MELNEKKTKSISFNFSKNYQFKTNLILKKQKVMNVDYLVKDANKDAVSS